MGYDYFDGDFDLVLSSQGDQEQELFIKKRLGLLDNY